MIASGAALLTPELRAALPPLYAQEKVDDPIVYAKYFTPDSRWTWYATEFDPEEERFFGLVIGHEREMGYFLLVELAISTGPCGLPIERDVWFTPRPLSECK